ncbi:hypothetical protein OIY81_2489 [Cryptosporidium canis]|uniref:Signal peptide-containing protein n=1 Tax=Cryptosporidium canis TaxID=195482 RepID=A0ABQ8P8G2_9CRYT|nr:hypothetical protein OIY81_2489 [Cryptosporidium canis]KAJ1612232.1 hypothetical protein OJ252_1321 [Cryptosporidium canis]
MRVLKLLFLIYPVFALWGFTEKGTATLQVSFIRAKLSSEREGCLDGGVQPEKHEPGNNGGGPLSEMSQLIDFDGSSQEDEDEDDEVISIDEIERSNTDKSGADGVDTSTGEESDNTQEEAAGSEQDEGELAIDPESEALGFHPELYFNSHKCILMIGFEIEFLENPVLSNSGIIKYIKEAEIDSVGEAVERKDAIEGDRYKLIELETRERKLEEIITLMKQIRDSCWNIVSESTLQEFKDQVLEITQVVQSKLDQIDLKIESYSRATDSEGPEFDSNSYERNMERRSRLLGRRSSFQLALISLTRIEDYWSHLESLPTSI